MTNKSTSILLTADKLVTDRACEVHAFQVNVTTAGQGASLIDGRDTATGEERWHLHSIANQSVGVHFDPPLPFHRGLYVDLESGVQNVSVHYTVLNADPQTEQLA